MPSSFANGHPPTVGLCQPWCTDLLIGLLVPPVLGGVVVAQALTDGLVQAGLVSEQLFRGERLPTLHMPANVKVP